MNCQESRYFFTPPPPHKLVVGGGLGVKIGGREGRDGWEGGCDGNYEVGAYGME